MIVVLLLLLLLWRLDLISLGQQSTVDFSFAIRSRGLRLLSWSLQSEHDLLPVCLGLCISVRRLVVLKALEHLIDTPDGQWVVDALLVAIIENEGLGNGYA